MQCAIYVLLQIISITFYNNACFKSEERGAPNRVFPRFLGNDRDNFGRLAALSMVDLRAVHFTQAQ